MINNNQISDLDKRRKLSISFERDEQLSAMWGRDTYTLRIKYKAASEHYEKELKKNIQDPETIKVLQKLVQEKSSDYDPVLESLKELEELNKSGKNTSSKTFSQEELQEFLENSLKDKEFNTYQEFVDFCGDYYSSFNIQKGFMIKGSSAYQSYVVKANDKTGVQINIKKPGAIVKELENYTIGDNKDTEKFNNLLERILNQEIPDIQILSLDENNKEMKIKYRSDYGDSETTIRLNDSEFASAKELIKQKDNFITFDSFFEGKTFDSYADLLTTIDKAINTVGQNFDKNSLRITAKRNADNSYTVDLSIKDLINERLLKSSVRLPASAKTELEEADVYGVAKSGDIKSFVENELKDKTFYSYQDFVDFCGDYYKELKIQNGFLGGGIYGCANFVVRAENSIGVQIGIKTGTTIVNEINQARKDPEKLKNIIQTIIDKKVPDIQFSIAKGRSDKDALKISYRNEYGPQELFIELDNTSLEAIKELIA